MKKLFSILFVTGLGFFPLAALGVVIAGDVVCTRCVGTTDLADNGVTSAKILNGTILNADINAAAAIDPSKIFGTAWTATTDGSGTGLDADYLDGLTSGQFLRSDQTGGLMGSLGIGTSSPAYVLDVNSPSSRVADNDYDGITFEKQAYPNQGSLLFSSDRSGYNFSIGNKRQADGDVLPIITMSDTGNVGIGTGIAITDIIDNKLEIENGNIGMDSDYGLIWGSGADAEYMKRITGVDALGFGTQNTERLRIDSYGNVGIGTSSPSQRLDVVGSVLVDGGDLVLDRSDGIESSIVVSASKQLAIQAAGGGSMNQFRVDAANIAFSGGNVGIGTTAPSQKLDVQGNIVATGTICGSAGCVGSSGSSQWTTSGSNIYYSTGNVGIGTTSPAAGLQVADDDGALFTGTLGSGSIPTTGAGTRMMWYPGKAAFRVGNATSTEWDTSNVGYYSVATGAWTKASGVSSVAMGDNNTATGDYSAAFGGYSDATGQGSFATGWSTSADGSYSAAFNKNSDVDGNYATAFGYNTTAESYGSVVLGRYNESVGDNTSWVSTDPLFVIGNGSSSSAKNDAFVVDKDGTIEVTGDITSDGEICIGSGC